MNKAQEVFFKYGLMEHGALTTAPYDDYSRCSSDAPAPSDDDALFVGATAGVDDDAHERMATLLSDAWRSLTRAAWLGEARPRAA